MVSKSILAMQLAGMTPDQVRERRAAEERLKASQPRKKHHDRVLSPEARQAVTAAKHGPLPGTGGRPRKGEVTAVQLESLRKGRETTQDRRLLRLVKILELVDAGFCKRSLLAGILRKDYAGLSDRTLRADFKELETLGFIVAWKAAYLMPAYSQGDSLERRFNRKRGRQ